MDKPVEARIPYYLRKINEQLKSRYHMDSQRRERRHVRLMKYKAAMNERLRAAGWKNAPL